MPKDSDREYERKETEAVNLVKMLVVMRLKKAAANGTTTSVRNVSGSLNGCIINHK